MAHTTSTIESLRASFGIPGALDFQIKRGDCVSALLRDSTGHLCEVSLYGAHVLDWRTPENSPLLFLSDRAVFSPGKAIRGGIPVVFPQFGNGALPAHGIARIVPWSVDRSTKHDDGSVEIVFSCQGAPGYETLWPHASLAEYSVHLGSTLRTTLTVKNRGPTPFSFQAAFHTYFSVADISSVSVRPFAQTEYLDALQGRSRARDERPEITFDAQTDRIYLDHTTPVTIEDRAARRSFLISVEGTKDVVVWNPWRERAAQLSDLAPDDWKRFVCVEPGIVQEAMTVAPGGSHLLSQVIESSTL